MRTAIPNLKTRATAVHTGSHKSWARAVGRARTAGTTRSDGKNTTAL